VLGVVLLIALALTAVVAVTTSTVTARSLERSNRDLNAAESAFTQLVDDRAEFAAAQASLVTALPIFRAHLTDDRLTRDAATLDAMADEYRRQLGADFLIVGDRAGRWIADPGGPSNAGASRPIVAAIATATGGASSRNIVADGRRLFLLVSEPAQFANEVLGTLTVGYALDDRVAERLAHVTHCDVNLVVAGHLYASSLPPADRAAFAAMISNDARLAGTVGNVQRIGSGEYVARTFPLTADRSGAAVGRLVLLQDWRPSQQFVDVIRRRLLIAGTITFIVAVCGGVVFSRRMSRPLHELAEAADEIASGNWTKQLVVEGSNEAIVMAQAVNTMTTSLRHLYEESKKRDDELRQAQKLEAIGRLAGGIAHDFNNVLTAIKAYGELLMEQLDRDDPRRYEVSGILQAGDRAANLTRQLLAFSRRHVVAPRVTALGEVVARTEQMLRRVIGEDIELLTSVAPDVGLVFVDAAQIEQVLLNLAVNARDAMPRGGTIRIDLANAVFDDAPHRRHRSLPPGAYVRLSMTDTGCGMSQDVVSHIFEPFYTTKEEGRGTGLGLSMAHGVIEEAGGAIDVESAVGKGTTFHLYLPRTTLPEHADDGNGRETGRADVRAAEAVLLAEDEIGLATLIANALTRSGYTVFKAISGEQALELAQTLKTPIDLLLTDVVMPGINGRELAERLTSTHRNMRVLYMTGYADDAILRHGLRTAEIHLIEKPFSMETLKARIREVLSAPVSFQPRSRRR
jgi:signal transduction histidine kinase/CheY-like chemotaxis protein